MSCPPAAFVQPAFLGHARSALRPGGMLVINCVTRLEEPFQAAVEALKVRVCAWCCLAESAHFALQMFNYVHIRLQGYGLSAEHCQAHLLTRQSFPSLLGGIA